MSFWAAVTKIFFCQSKLIHAVWYSLQFNFVKLLFLNCSMFPLSLNKAWPTSTLSILSTVTSSHRSQNTTELANLWSGTQLISFNLDIVFPMCFTFFCIQEPRNWSVIISTTLKNCWLFLFCVYTTHKGFFTSYLKKTLNKNWQDESQKKKTTFHKKTKKNQKKIFVPIYSSRLHLNKTYSTRDLLKWDFMFLLM